MKKKIIFLLFLFSIFSLEVRSKNKSSLLIYLHGMRKLKKNHHFKGPKGLIEIANKKGFEVLIPKAPGRCYYLSPPRLDLNCWDHIYFKDLDFIKEEIKKLEDKKGKFRKKLIVGFSNGGYFLGGALQRNLLKEFDAVGIISGGSIGKETPKEEAYFPPTFIEIAKKDKWNRPSGERLISLLNKKRGEEKLFFRFIDREHSIDQYSLESYFNWIMNHFVKF